MLPIAVAWRGMQGFFEVELGGYEPHLGTAPLMTKSEPELPLFEGLP